MMQWIVGSSLKFRFLVIAIAAAMMLFGAVKFRDMPVDVFPEFGPPRVEVQTEALGLSAAEVESLITLNLEELLSGTSWLQTIRSQSVPGLSSVVLTFKPGTDLMRARQLMQERLTLAYTLPNVSKRPVMLQPVSATSRVMMVGLSSKQLSPIQVSVLARWTVKPRLMGVPGVANVAIWGQRERQLQVLIDPERLKAGRVTQDQIIRTTGDAMWVSPLSFLNASFPGTGGWIDTPNQRLGVQHIFPISSPEELARIPVDGSNLRLGDVANVVEGHPPLIGDALLSDGPGLLLVIEKFPGANTLEVTRGVDAALDALRHGLPGVAIDSQVFRAASFIETAFDNLTMVLLASLVLVVLALGALFYEWRTALISLIAVPLSMVAALAVFYLRGATINTMVLVGLVIALAAVIDDAIIDVENIARRLRRRRQDGSDASLTRVILDASLEVRGAIVYATLIVVLAVVPVFFMEGLSGTFFRPLAFSYVLAVLASMVVAMTVTPALALILLSHAPRERRESPLLRLVRGVYDGIFSRAIRAPRIALLAAVVIVLVGLAVWPRLGQSLLPAFRERHLLIEWTGAPGTSHPAMYRIMTQAGRELRSIPGVRNVGAHVGRAVTGDQVVGINSSQLWVTLDAEVDYAGTVAKVQGVVDGYPGLSHKVQTYLTDRIRDVLTGANEDIVVRIYGPERETLRRQADEVKQVMSKINGVVDLQVEGQVEEPNVQIKVDLARAERHGLKPGDVRRQTATIFAGLTVGSLFEQQKVFEVVVWGTPETRHNLSSIRDFLLETPKGPPVRLGELAEVRVVPSPTVIRHEAISPSVDVVANVRGSDPGVVAREVEQRLKEVKFPLEVHPELLGEYAERQAAQRRMLSFAIAAAVGIFLLLQASVRSWRLASLVFLTLPVALAGGVLAALAFGGTVSLGSIVGFLAVFGIAARTSIMLIRHCQDLERHEGEPFGAGLVLRATHELFLPIVMTAVTTGLALLPLVLFGDAAGLEIVRPMVIVILGGLVVSTLVNLFVVPALYLRFGAQREPDLELLPAPAVRAGMPSSA